MASLPTRLAHAWNIFRANEADQAKPRPYQESWGGVNYGRRPDAPLQMYSNERSIVGSIYTRLAIDLAGVDIRHVRRDDQDRYVDDMPSAIQNCLQVEANLDQAARMFRQDFFSTLIEKGCAAVVPIDTTVNPEVGGFDILTMRVGEIQTWFPSHVRVSVYNEKTGMREEVTIAKKACAIVENPLYRVMNEPNSTLKRLTAKLIMLDAVDKQSASGKMDLIIQLPYVVRSEKRRQDAEQRRKDIEVQMKDSQYGIAWADGTEKITQLNRPVENNLMAQVEFLTKELYGELGLTQDIMLGTANEDEILNYWGRTLEPLLTALVEEMIRKFLTKTARSQKQWILFFRDAFKLIPIGGEHGLASAFDIFARNEILTANEIRGVMGFRPSDEPRADQLVNSNMPQPGATAPGGDVVDGTATDIGGLLSEFGDGEEVTSEAA